MKALIVEDDRILSNNICEILKSQYEMSQAFDGVEGLSRLSRERFDVVILDVMMPKLNGYEVLEQMRSGGLDTPVLMLTALDQTADQVRGLRSGADDYLCKPFDLDIFQARLEALLRRSRRDAPAGEERHRFLDLRMDTARRVAYIGGERLELHGRQFDFLLNLVENRNIIVHKERLFQRVWGFYSTTEFSVVEVYASQIRKQLRKFDYDKYLKTVRGIGYILTDDSELYG